MKEWQFTAAISHLWTFHNVKRDYKWLKNYNVHTIIPFISVHGKNCDKIARVRLLLWCGNVTVSTYLLAKEIFLMKKKQWWRSSEACVCVCPWTDRYALCRSISGIRSDGIWTSALSAQPSLKIPFNSLVFLRPNQVQDLSVSSKCTGEGAWIHTLLSHHGIHTSRVWTCSALLCLHVFTTVLHGKEIHNDEKQQRHHRRSLAPETCVLNRSARVLVMEFSNYRLAGWGFCLLILLQQLYLASKRHPPSPPSSLPRFFALRLRDSRWNIKRSFKAWTVVL